MKLLIKKSINSSINASSPEIELLLYCAHTSVTSETKAKIEKLLQGQVNWSYLINIANQHGTIPLLYQSLKLGYSDIIPEDILQKLRTISHQIALSNTIFSKHLFNIIELLKINDIQAIPFKGIVLAASVYGNLGLRHFGDLDILVSKSNFLSACNILITQGGYQPVWQHNLLNSNLEISLLKSRDEYSLINGFVSIDLHQVLTAEHLFSSQFIFEDLVTRLMPVSISGHTILSLGTEDLLLYLCVHGSKECWRSLKWICDISEFLHRYPDLDWHHLIQRAQGIGCERMLLLGLLLAHEVLGASLPFAIDQKIQADIECKRLSDEFTRRLFWENNRLSNRLTIEKAWIHSRMVDKLQDKWACLWDLRRAIWEYIIKCIPNRKDQDFLPLPRPLYFFYYFIRPIRLLSKLFMRGKNTSVQD